VAVDLDEARSLLDQAGVNPESLTIELMAYNDRPEFGDVAAVIQDELGQLGIDVKIRAGEYASLEPDMLSGEFDAALLSRGYLVDVPDPAGFLHSDYMCEGGYNIAHYCDPETDRMIQETSATEDEAARNEQYQQIGEKLQSEVYTMQ
jgi:peptide/nickel transport system substrate-binding protein